MHEEAESRRRVCTARGRSLLQSKNIALLDSVLQANCTRPQADHEVVEKSVLSSNSSNCSSSSLTPLTPITPDCGKEASANGLLNLAPNSSPLTVLGSIAPSGPPMPLHPAGVIPGPGGDLNGHMNSSNISPSGGAGAPTHLSAMSGKFASVLVAAAQPTARPLPHPRCPHGSSRRSGLHQSRTQCAYALAERQCWSTAECESTPQQQFIVIRLGQSHFVAPFASDARLQELGPQAHASAHRAQREAIAHTANVLQRQPKARCLDEGAVGRDDRTVAARDPRLVCTRWKEGWWWTTRLFPVTSHYWHRSVLMGANSG